MANLGLPKLVASSTDTLVEIAVRLANAHAHLYELHRTLRPRVEASPLDGRSESSDSLTA